MGASRAMRACYGRLSDFPVASPSKQPFKLRRRMGSSQHRNERRRQKQVIPRRFPRKLRQRKMEPERRHMAMPIRTTRHINPGKPIRQKPQRNQPLRRTRTTSPRSTQMGSTTGRTNSTRLIDRRHQQTTDPGKLLARQTQPTTSKQRRYQNWDQKSRKRRTKLR